VDLEKVRSAIELKFWELFESLVQQQGLNLYDLQYLPGQHLLRVFIWDKATKTATLDDCVKIDKAFDPYLEESWVPTELTLEVSSPGVYRELNCQEHLRQAQGDLVQLTLFNKLLLSERPGLPKKFNGQKKVRGFLKKIDQEVVVDLGQYDLTLTFDDIKKANLDPELGQLMR